MQSLDLKKYEIVTASVEQLGAALAANRPNVVEGKSAYTLGEIIASLKNITKVAESMITFAVDGVDVKEGMLVMNRGDFDAKGTGLSEQFLGDKRPVVRVLIVRGITVEPNDEITAKLYRGILGAPAYEHDTGFTLHHKGGKTWISGEEPRPLIFLTSEQLDDLLAQYRSSVRATRYAVGSEVTLYRKVDISGREVFMEKKRGVVTQIMPVDPRYATQPISISSNGVETQYYLSGISNGVEFRYALGLRPDDLDRERNYYMVV